MLAKHSGIYLLAKIVPATLTLSTLAIFTRYLTPEQYGTYSLTILAAGVFNAVCLQWVVLSVGRYLPDCRSREEMSELVGTARAVILIISSVLFVVFLILNYFKNVIGFPILFYIMIFLVPAQSWYDLNLKIMNAQLRPVQYSLVLGTKSIIAFVFGVVTVYIGWGSDGAVISLGVGLVFATNFTKGIWKSVPWMLISKKKLTKLWHYGAPLTGSFLLIFIIDSSDRFFIDKLLGSHDLGTYSAAYDFTQYSIGTLLAVVHLAAFPLIVNAYTKMGLIAAQNELKKTFVLVLAVLSPSCVGLALVADNVAQVILGKEFVQGAAGIIPWIALALFFSFIRSYYFDYAFQLASSTSKQFIPIFFAAMSNLVLNAWLIPLYGVRGAAIATVLSFMVALLGSVILGRKLFAMPSFAWSELCKILISVFLMVTLITNVPIDQPTISLIAQVFCGSLIYLFCILLMNVSNARVWFFSKIKGR
jgi:O-antigen/teichoic acid export membrane protein